MYIKNINLKNYRNYNDLNISFDEKLNIFYGNNAQGKTNILEAIYFAITTKSQKGSNEKELINFDSDFSIVNLEVQKKEKLIKYNYNIFRDKKRKVLLNNIPIKKAREIIGNINVIFFSPEDLNIIKDSPIKRRRFIDMELCQIDKVYLNNLSKYNKILKERNFILKDKKYESKREEILDIYDVQLYEYGYKIIQERQKFINNLNKIIFNIHNSLTNNNEILELIYCPNIDKENFLKKLKLNRKKDLILKTTSIGPHRDDFLFFINGKDVKKYGSQGQQRTSALSLKLSELELVKEKIGDNPILLLDDVLSELDNLRQGYLINSIKNVQVFLTCTGVENFVKTHFKNSKIFYVENGNVK